jgi:DNA polymerase I-like protein with 3'-5' exonuclease and polymerase domains/uracil-DNA glycosylase
LAIRSIALIKNPFFLTVRKSGTANNQIYVSPEGVQIKATLVDKYFRDIVRYQIGEFVVEATGKKGEKLATVYDPANPLGGTVLTPGPNSPICQKCKLHENNAENPYMEAWGSKTPLITVLFENVSPKEDQNGVLGKSGFNLRLRDHLLALAKPMGITEEDIRWIAMSRCANREKKIVDYKGKAHYCRLHAIQDLALYPPKLVLPVGSVALGALSHKSNANDWAGRLLTYRGWPDDWLTDKAFVFPRVNPIDPEGPKIVGHPLFGPPPDFSAYLPMVPVMAPRLVYAAQNPYVDARWIKQIRTALEAAKNGVKAKEYLRPWYRVIDDPDELEKALQELIDAPRLTLCYDTETTGVRAWAEDAAIVFAMFRWRDPKTGEPKSLGFPWNYPGLDFENRIQPAIPRLSKLLLAALYKHNLVGHNLTFDILYTFANVPGADLDALCEAMMWDTWHMIYTLRQRPGTLGLESITYDYVPDLAGYEEDMTLMIELNHETMHPEGKVNGVRGHYANCPRGSWDTHLIPYVMGDVETCYQAHETALAQLDKARQYQIPLAHPTRRSEFRQFKAPGRAFVYKNIMSPASMTLAKMMGRGMEIDTDELTRLEGQYPTRIEEAKLKLKNTDPRILDWCIGEKNQNPDFELDLENKKQLKTILFDILKLPINRLTKAGKKAFGEDEKAYGKISREDLVEYAALDKFTLNKLAVDNEQIRPLQEYRKIFKLYSTYVRPLRNIMTVGIDKNARNKDQHLCKDSRIHASFLLTGTRGGRLSCKDPNLQQLPREGDVKSMFVSRWSKMGRKGCLYQGDLSQIELRLLAAVCGDPSMVKAYFDEVDLHSLTTSRIFKIPYEHFSKDYMKFLQKNGKDKEAKDLDQQRQIGKITNFLTGYGGGSFGLQNTLAARAIYLPIEECEMIIESFFDAYPSLKKHIQKYKWFIQESGVAVSIFGRVRIFEEVFSEDKEAISKALRAGYNHLIQSTASDMMLMALVAIENLMREAGLESMLVSTVHDSLLIDALQEELPQVHEITDMVLNNFDKVLPTYFGDDYDTSWMIVPITGDCEVGLNYLDSKKIRGDKIDWDELLYPKRDATKN